MILVVAHLPELHAPVLTGHAHQHHRRGRRRKSGTVQRSGGRRFQRRKRRKRRSMAGHLPIPHQAALVLPQADLKNSPRRPLRSLRPPQALPCSPGSLLSSIVWFLSFLLSPCRGPGDEGRGKRRLPRANPRPLPSLLLRFPFLRPPPFIAVVRQPWREREKGNAASVHRGRAIITARRHRMAKDSPHHCRSAFLPAMATSLLHIRHRCSASR